MPARGIAVVEIASRTHRYSLTRLAGRAVALALLCAAAATGRSAAANLWVSLDGSPQDTEAEVVFDAAASSVQASFFDLTIHGFWRTDSLAGDGRTYQVLYFPGLGAIGQIGAPGLPAEQVRLGIVTGAIDAMLTQATESSSQDFPGMRPYPLTVTDSTGAEIFATDSTIYNGRAAWPAVAADAEARADTLFGVAVEASPREYPVTWDPVTGVLHVASHVRYGYAHGGVERVSDQMTKHTRAVVSHLLLNWDEVAADDPPNVTKYQGEYLFLCAPGYESTIQPLLQQKKQLGFNVAVDTATIPNYVAIHSRILSWYKSTPAPGEHYCVLVGPETALPFGKWLPWTFTQNVLWYGFDQNSIKGDGAYRGMGDTWWGSIDVNVGRLDGTDPSLISSQIQRILAYESQALSYAGSERMLLVSGISDSPDLVQTSSLTTWQEGVRTYAGYSEHPVFQTLYYDVLGSDDPLLITNAVNAGAGIVSFLSDAQGVVPTDFRLSGLWGLREMTTWPYFQTGWFPGPDSVGFSQLNNDGKCPVVWSLGPFTGGVWRTTPLNPPGDPYDFVGTGLRWMQQGNKGAVAAIANPWSSTIWGKRDMRRMATYLPRQVFQYGNKVHGLALAAALLQPLEARDEVMALTLLGDPAMTVRTKFNVFGAVTPIATPIGASSVGVQILDANNQPLPGITVALWKPGSGAAAQTGGGSAAPSRSTDRLTDVPDEVRDNAYTDANGWVTLPVQTATPGELYVTAYDDDGSVVQDSILVTDPVTAAALNARQARATLSITPNVVKHGAGVSVSFGRSPSARTRVSIVSVDGRVVRALDIPAGEAAVRWNGRDARGQRVAPGVYFARSAAAPRAARVVVLP